MIHIVNVAVGHYTLLLKLNKMLSKPITKIISQQCRRDEMFDVKPEKQENKSMKRDKI